MEVKIKYFNNNLTKIEKFDNGDWIDLRSSIDCIIKKDEFKLIPLGIGMILPDGYEAHIVPRGSTYKNYKTLQTNHLGIVDNSYNGDGDEWFLPVYAMEDTEIKMDDRICQFRIVENMPKFNFVEVDCLNNTNRGGHGSTGKV